MNHPPIPSVRLPLPPFVSRILARLAAAGHTSYVVGGAVRDAWMGRPTDDWDLATSASPGQIRDLFEDTRHFHLKHNTVTLVHSGRHHHITTFRGAQGDIYSDLARRDFTINAMAYDPETVAILDPFEGKKDLSRKRIRAVGEPGERLREDPLRMLRAVRFACELDFYIDPPTMRSLSGLSGRLNTISPERIRDEWMKMLVTPRASEGTRLMQRTGLLEQVAPELLEGCRKRQGPPGAPTIFRHGLETLAWVEPTVVLRLSALFHDVGKARVRIKRNGQYRFPGHHKEGERMARAALNRLRFGQSVLQQVCSLIRRHGIQYHSLWSDGDVRRFIVSVGKEQIWDLIRLRRADLRAWAWGDPPHPVASPNELPAPQRLLDELGARIQEQLKNPFPTSVQDLALDGRTVMGILGLSPGPTVGRVLQRLLEQVIEHPEWNTPEGLKRITEGLKAAALS